MVVQLNLNAMNFSRRIEAVSSIQPKSFEKISSEQQVNKAADDAAGLRISGKMKKQMESLNSSTTNAQESVSSVQTAEDALSKVQSKLERMYEYAVEASDTSKSKEDRDLIQSEMVQLSKEINQIAETTKFKDAYLLKGSDSTTQYYSKARDAGLEGTLTDEAAKATFEIKTLSPEDKVVIGGKEYTIGYPSIAYGENMDYASLASDYAQEEYNARVEKNKYSFASEEYNEWDRREAYCRSRKLECKKLEQANDSVITADKAYEYMQEELTVANNIGTVTKPSVVTTSVDEEQSKVTFSIEKGYTEGNAPLNLTLHTGSDADMTNKVSVDIKAMDTANLGLEGINVSDETGVVAAYTKDAIADAIAMVAEQSSFLGEAKAKVENTISNLDNKIGNTTSVDTDQADEMVENAKKNILAQANQAMLAQANQMTQRVLSLLQ